LKVIISAIGRMPTKAAPTATPAIASSAIGLLADQEDRGVAAHLLPHRLVERVAHGEGGHG
jgi:hypothetical protein